jgi:hypothetical protein
VPGPARTAYVWSVIAARDLGNRRRYGRAAPRTFERIWIDPSACEQRIQGFDERRSGRVVDGDWDLDNPPTDELPKIEFCRLHWEAGVPWAETGMFEYLLERIDRQGAPLYGCRTRADLVQRYESLDRVFEQVREEGRLRTRDELDAGAIRERGGIFVHIGRWGQPVFAKEGCHRLAMARALALPTVPAQVGTVHPEALGIWRQRYTTPPAGADARRVVSVEEAGPRARLPRQP